MKNNNDFISNLLIENKEFDRHYLSHKILSHFFPEYKSIYFINDPSCFESKIFDFISTTNNKNILICQTEECFLDINNNSTKRKIFDFAKKYNKNIKLITNSVLDYHESKNLMNTSFRPGILDLICYTDFFTYKNIDIENIKFHSAFVYQNFNPARDEVINFINNKDLESKLSYIKYLPRNFLIQNIKIDANHKFKNMDDGFFPDAPYDSFLDIEWSKNISFFTEVE